MNEIKTRVPALIVKFLTPLEAKPEMESDNFAMKSFSIII